MVATQRFPIFRFRSFRSPQDGDFFFSIDCGVSPEQRSSVEESDGHAIQFVAWILFQSSRKRVLQTCLISNILFAYSMILIFCKHE